jgi:L-amino acid N-acyltransferase YncA
MNKPITLEDLRDRIAFRFATVEDVSELMSLYKHFYAEAIYKDLLDLDPARVEDTIYEEITLDTRPHILAVNEEDRRIVGFISFSLDHSFSVKPCLVLLEFYVVPEFRRGAIGRGLLAMAILEGQRLGAGAFHAPVASGVREVRSLINMFMKAGFTPFGVMLRRKL